MANKDNVYIDMDKRIFYLSDEIDNNVVGKLCYQLLMLNEQDDEREKKEVGYKRKPIKLYIQSFGGSVYDALAFVDSIMNSKTPVWTYSNGYAMSAGFLIFLAGQKRYATRHTTFLYHQISFWLGNSKFQEFVDNVKEMEYIQEKCEDFVCSRTKIKKTQLLKIRNSKQDFYIHSNDFVKLGICEVVE